MQEDTLIKSKQSGATYVEMAFSITLFVFIIVTVIELMRFGYTVATLQHVLDTSLRAASISEFNASAGANCINPATKYIPAIRAACIQNTVKDLANKFLSKKVNSWLSTEFVYVKAYPKLSDIANPVSGTLTNPCIFTVLASGGNENEYVSICINYQFDLFMGIKKNILTFGISKNEYFKD